MTPDQPAQPQPLEIARLRELVDNRVGTADLSDGQASSLAAVLDRLTHLEGRPPEPCQQYRQGDVADDVCACGAAKFRHDPAPSLEGQRGWTYHDVELVVCAKNKYPEGSTPYQELGELAARIQSFATAEAGEEGALARADELAQAIQSHLIRTPDDPLGPGEDALVDAYFAARNPATKGHRGRGRMSLRCVFGLHDYVDGRGWRMPDWWMVGSPPCRYVCSRCPAVKWHPRPKDTP